MHLNIEIDVSWLPNEPYFETKCIYYYLKPASGLLNETHNVETETLF